jgi:PhzF family phenazine biosynthesis protein
VTGVRVYHYEAFAAVPGMGNPAGVAFDRDVPADAMQLVARRVGFNETVFVTAVRPGEVALRYFTPGHEVDLCGHATVAAFAALHGRGLLTPHPDRPADYTLAARAGDLPVRVEAGGDGAVVVWVGQPAARFVPFAGDPAALAAALGVGPADLSPDLPVVYGNTGLWTLLVPTRSLAAVRRMRPATATFPAVLARMPRASVHPFCLEALDPSCQLHGRHFSSPYSGTVEDPVTGTASGAMGAYYARYVAPAAYHRLRVEQGQEVGRDGRVEVEVRADGDARRPRVGGAAVFVADLGVVG